MRGNRNLPIQGYCVGCGRQTYGKPGDPAPDPRGMPEGMEGRTSFPFSAMDYEMMGPDVPACLDCRDNGDKYRAALERAKLQWQPAPKCAVCPQRFPRGLTPGGSVPGHGEKWQSCPGSYKAPAVSA